MKRMILYATAVTLLFSQAAFPAIKDDAAGKVSAAESKKKSLEANAELSQFIPFDTFYAAAASVDRARSLFDDGKYEDAMHKAREAGILLETAGITAQARAARHQRMKLVTDASTLGIMTNPVMDAQFFKKGDIFRANLYDRQIFTMKKNHVYYKLSQEGRERLDKIIRVLDVYPDYRVKIIGHTAESDYNDYSKQKADIVARYLLGKNIASDRIEVIGLGNKEVLDTHLGFRRVDRVEFVLSIPK